MNHKQLIASFCLVFGLFSLATAQALVPGSITFKNIQGPVTAENVRTGTVQDITPESQLGEGFTIQTQSDSFTDVIFSNGVVARISPKTRLTVEVFTAPSARNQAAAQQAGAAQPTLQLNLVRGDILLNASEKHSGALVIKTPTTEIRPQLTQLYVAHGSTTSHTQEITRVLNLGNQPIDVSSSVDGEFALGPQNVSYGNHNVTAETKSLTLREDESAVVLAQKPEDTPRVIDADEPKYSTLAHDDCAVDRLGTVAEQILSDAEDPFALILVTYADPYASYFDINTGAIGELRAGMTLNAGTIVRTPHNGKVTLVYPNGASLDIHPGSNVFLESLVLHPMTSGGVVAQLAHIGIRVEAGMVLANTLNSGNHDTFSLISPLDRHFVNANTVVSVEFSQIDTTAFQTITQNITPAGATGVSTVVVTSSNLSFISDAVTFIEFSAEGNPFSFSTPPAFTHITESAIIPPNYDFIDRTIALAAPAVGGPTPLGTPVNPGNIQRYTDEPDPVTP